MSIVLAWLPRLIEAAFLTIALAAAIFVLSGVSGLILAFVTYRRGKSHRTKAVEVFSAFFRSIPELVVLFFFFFGASSLGLDFGPIGSAVIAFWLVGTAYDYQVFKGALSAIASGQYEAGQSLGLRPSKISYLILLPQLIPLAKKGWITYAIGTVKRVSIASAVSVSEILYVTKQAIAATNQPFIFLGTAVALYILIVTPLLIWNEQLPGPERG